MALKAAVKDLVFLLLDSQFEVPRWREALVVEVDKEKYKMVVRVSEAEGQLQKIRSRCPAVPLPLLPPLAWWRRSPWRSSLQTGFA